MKYILNASFNFMYDVTTLQQMFSSPFGSFQSLWLQMSFLQIMIHFVFLFLHLTASCKHLLLAVCFSVSASDWHTRAQHGDKQFCNSIPLL